MAILALGPELLVPLQQVGQLLPSDVIRMMTMMLRVWREPKGQIFQHLYSNDGASKIAQNLKLAIRRKLILKIWDELKWWHLKKYFSYRDEKNHVLKNISSVL